MVNSGSFDSDVDRNEKDGFTQSDRVAESPQSVISMHVVAGSLCENDFTTQTADSLPVSQAIEPTATKTEYKCNMSELFVGADDILTLQCNSQDSGVSLGYSKNSTHKTLIAPERSLAGIRKPTVINRDHEFDKQQTKNEVQTKDSAVRTKPSVCCSVPLEKVQDVLKACSTSIRNKHIIANLQSTKQTAKKDMCLYCDRTFITSSLKQKHVDRSHSSKHNRRLSARRQVAKQSAAACMFCEKLNNTECSLKQLFEHLVLEHPRKYFGCLECEIRFSNLQVFQNHNVKVHGSAKELPEETNSSVLVLKERKDDIAQDKLIADKSDKVTNNSRRNGKQVEDDNLEPKTVKLKPANKKITKLCGPNFARNSLQADLSDRQGTIRVKIKNKCKSRFLNENTKAEQEKEKSVPTAPDLSESVEVSSNNAPDTVPEEKAHFNKGKSKANWVKELRNKKVSVLSTKVGMKQCLRTTRQRSKILENAKNSKRKITANKVDRNVGANVATKYLPYTHNPYPSFDVSFRVKKITDHSIDNIRISSMTFDDVFDKAFFNRVKCNIQENLLNYVDGKLFKSVESENRISSFQKTKDVQTEEPNQNCGSKISSNAITPVAALLTTAQFGEDLESQIEYGSKPSKKKTVPVVDDEVHYKYFTRRKYQAVISESREHRDLSKLDMWTQLAVKNRQQKLSSERKTDKEILEYTKTDEYKVKMQVEELNNILDKRGPLEDLKEEAIRTVALEKLNGAIVETHIENYFDVTIILNELLNGLFSTEPCSDTVREDIENNCFATNNSEHASGTSLQSEEIPNILNLRRVSNTPQERLVENSPANATDKTIIELTGEWARSRIYVCAACGTKMPNAKSLIDHKNLFHEHVWCQHYEFVGNQGELYRHLSIPALGKIGEIEESSGNKMWRRSDSRLCSKCNKRFNCLGDLHRHILECGGDWSWMLARKKYKYRPYGSKARKKKRGLLRFLHTFRERKSDQAREKRKNIKKYNGPRQKPSDADTIQRMLANLPAKRITRKVISMKDGFQRTLKNQKISKTNKNKSLRKQKLSANKATNKTLHKDQGGIKNSRKSRRLLRSNSNIMFENKGNMILPKFKKDRNGSNTANLSLRRHSVRNINKVLVNKIMKTNGAKTKSKFSSKQEENVDNSDVTESLESNAEFPNKSASENSLANQTKILKKTRSTRYTKKVNDINVGKIEKENTSAVHLPLENISKDLKCVKSKILATEETIISDTAPQKKNLQNDLDTITSTQLNKNMNQPEPPITPISDDVQVLKKSSKTKTRLKNSNLQNNQGDASTDHAELPLHVNHEDQLPPILIVTKPQLKLPKSDKKIKKKKKKQTKLLLDINGTDFCESKTLTIVPVLHSKTQNVNKNTNATIRTSCRKRSKVNKTKSSMSNLKVAVKKIRPTRIKKKITKIVQVDGSSQSTPSTRSKSSKKEFCNPVFLCNSNDHMILTNNVPQIAEDLSDLPTLDNVAENIIEQSSTRNAEIGDCSNTLSANSSDTIESKVDNLTIAEETLENTNSNGINKSSVVISGNTLNLHDTKEQPVSASNNLSVTIANAAKKNTTKKLRGLNDCIAMLTNKLQDKSTFQANFNDNKTTAVFSTTKKVSTSPVLFQWDTVSKKYERKHNIEANFTIQSPSETIPQVCIEHLNKSIGESNEVKAIQNITNENKVGVVNNTESYDLEWTSKNASSDTSTDINETPIINQFSAEQLNKTKTFKNNSVNYKKSVNELLNKRNAPHIIPSTFDHVQNISKKAVENTIEAVDCCTTVVEINETEDKTKTEVPECAAHKTVEVASAKNCITNLQNAFIKKDVSKSMKVPARKHKNLKNKITFGQNCDTDNIPQLPAEIYSQLEKAEYKKPKTNRKQKKKQLKVSYLHNGKSLRNRHRQTNNSKNKFRQIEFMNGAELFSNSSRRTSKSTKNKKITDDISNIKLIQNLTDNDQEGMLNTSDELSNSGKENLIVNKIIKAPKYRKTKNSKTKNTKKPKKLSTESITCKFAQDDVVLLKPSELDVPNNTNENTIHVSDISEFVDSEDDVPLAQFINKHSNCNVISTENDASSLNLQLHEEAPRNEVKENLGKVLENDVLNGISSSAFQEKYCQETDAKSIGDGDATELPRSGLLPEAITSELLPSKKSNGLKMIVQISNVGTVNKKHPKINVNKLRRQKKFTKHRKRKNGDITSIHNKNKESLVLLDNVAFDDCKNFSEENVTEASSLDLVESIVEVQASDKEECADVYVERRIEENPDIFSNEGDVLLESTVTTDFLSASSNDGIFNNENLEKSPRNYVMQVENNQTSDDIVNDDLEISTENKSACADSEDNDITSEQTLQETAEEAKVITNEGKLKISATKAKSKLKTQLKANGKSKNVKVKASSKCKDTNNTSNVFCNICNKTFTRSENLLKHKRTLTHIAKLSELEALEAVEKSKEEIITLENLTGRDISQKDLTVASKCDLNISDILCSVDNTMEHNEYRQNTPIPTTFTMAAAQDSLKLVDIINDVLSKPVDDEYLKHNNFSNLILKTDLEVKRCKSLGERKSFDCDKLQILSNTSPPSTHDLNLESSFVNRKTASTADVIVEKQISLLENMIEDNRINFKPTEKMFISAKLPITEEYSSQSSSSEFSLLSSSKPEECSEITFTHNTNIITNLIKPTLDEDHLMQATQYEEISEDSSSSHYQFEEQKSRKALNRDEELFLECCSLLKSSSDVSDLCKKSAKSTQFLNNFGLKPLDEMEWLEQKQLPQKNTNFDHTSNIMLDDSHINNSVSDNFCNDLSYSNSSASNCNLNLKVFLDRNENDNLFSQPPIFEDISAESEDSSEKSLTRCFTNFLSIPNTMNGHNVVNNKLTEDDRTSPSVESAQIPEEYKSDEYVSEEKRAIILKFGSMKSRALKNKPDADLPNIEDTKTSISKTTQSCITDYAVSKKAKKGENKKMLTKGAMKVFEGLKVSIPKEGLDMKEVLSCSPTSKRLELEAEQESAVEKKVCSEKEKVIKPNPIFSKTISSTGNKKTVLKKLGNKLGLKIKKKCIPNRKSALKTKGNFMDNEKKSHDIYDFEETQDSIDVFSKNTNSLPIYHSFRNKVSDKSVDLTKSTSIDKTSECDQYSNIDEANSNCEGDNSNISKEEKSSNSSSLMIAPSTKKINMHKSITKKKCMIMGRIFKNAIKSKTDEIKNIPVIENSQIVEDYVQNCQDVPSKDASDNIEHKLSEEEMNILFDNLLNEEKPRSIANKVRDKNGEAGEHETSVVGSAVAKTCENKPKSKVRCKKRQRGNSSDSSDEEFSIKKIPKKHCNRKNSSNNECVINLEQELKECIGVASRKSQRKCTSGKQNVLVEYWSSDESSFDIEQTVAPMENTQNVKETLVESVPTFSTTSQNYSNDNVITNNEEQKDESTVLSLETNTYDTNSNNSKEKKKQAWNESSLKLINSHSKKREVLKASKKAETTEDHEIVDSQTIAVRRQKRTAVDTLYYWSSSSEDELQDVIEVKPIREEYDDEDRPLQQGWIVGDSPKKLVTMLAQAKGKKVDAECVKKNRKKRTSV